MTTALDKITDQVKGTVPTTKGFIVEGIAYHVTPFNQRTIFDFTTPPGKASGMLIGYFFYLGKRGFRVEKIEDWMEISPVHQQFYQITIQQKQTLERQIKEGLASISTAIADFELAWHDLRKYEEFMNMFEMIEKAKKEKDEKKMMEGEQTLKSIFIDQVDVHTGEGIALKLIAPRWPTIIADFMRLKDEDVDPKKIAETYKVSEAEGVVLATKNKLYKEWKRMFRETVESRYGRLKGLVEARRKSIQEYRNMLKPYVARYRSIRELGETPEGRQVLERRSFYRQAAQAVSIDITRTWAWRPLIGPRFAKEARVGLSETRSLFKMPFPKKFKQILKDYTRMLEDEKRTAQLEKFWKEFGNLKTSPIGIEPLDDFVLQWYPVIEEHYGIEFSPVDILKVRNEFVKECIAKEWTSPYFLTMDIGASRTVIRTPQGVEIEDLWLEPFYAYVDTQNVILLRMLELKAKEMESEHYISDMLGETVEGKPIKEVIEEEYPTMYKGPVKAEEKKEERKSPLESIKKAWERTGFPLKFFKPGPYDPHFEDLFTAIFIPEIISSVYGPSVNIFKATMGVPGVKVPT